MKKNWPTLLLVGSIIAWIGFMGMYGDTPLARRDWITSVKGLLTLFLIAACMIYWKTSSSEMHDSSNPKYSMIDHYGWWISWLSLVAVLVTFVALVVF
jgi:hypothetical protein